MAFFFYGTLMDEDVLAAVLGHASGGLPRSTAVLAGFRRVKARGASYPVIIPAAGTETEGLLVAGLTIADARRLAGYEGDGYRCRRLSVCCGGQGSVIASVFVPRWPAMASDQPWSLDDWRRDHKAGFLERLVSNLGRAGSAGSADRANHQKP